MGDATTSNNSYIKSFETTFSIAYCYICFSPQQIIYPADQNESFEEGD